MKTKIVCLLLPLFLFGCSKKPTEPTEINGMAEKQDIAPSSALPFEITTVWPDSESREMIDTKKQATSLIEAKDYDDLDTLAAKLRSSKESYAIGFWKLGDIYEGLSLSDNASDSEWDNRITTLKDWITAKPDSITARVALAYVLVDYAWKARGSGYAGTVADNGWQLYGERLNQAMQVLDAAKDLKDKSPVYWAVRMRAALGLQMNKTQFNDLFNQAISNSPDYAVIYRQRATYLMPRWFGSEGELEDDLEKSANKIGGEDGDMLYAQVVWEIHARAGSPNVIKENGFSWPRVNRGFEVIEKRFPDSLAAISEHAYLAAYAGDAATACECLKKTGGKADLAVWYYKDEYIRIANWAFEK